MILVFSSNGKSLALRIQYIKEVCLQFLMTMMVALPKYLPLVDTRSFRSTATTLFRTSVVSNFRQLAVETSIITYGKNDTIFNGHLDCQLLSPS